MRVAPKITPYLAFENQAEEAAAFYVSVLPNSRLGRRMNHPATGELLTVEFQLAGMDFVALNVGERWEFTEAISLSVSCDSQEEIDDLWGKLSEGGREVQCGWLKDRFGVSWQIVPASLIEMLTDADADPAKAQRTFNAMLGMIKLDLAALEAAYHGTGRPD